MLSFSPWGGLGEPWEACVKCGGRPSTLGAYAPTRGALPKNSVGSKKHSPLLRKGFKYGII
jgi:hypothetical protein